MRIGEVAKISRCPAVTIRYYEKIGLLPNAKRTAANYRIYDQNDLERLRFIRHCRNHGMSLADIEKLLSIKDDGSALHDGDIVAIIESHRKNIKAQIASLDALLRKLDELVADPKGHKKRGEDRRFCREDTNCLHAGCLSCFGLWSGGVRRRRTGIF